MLLEKADYVIAVAEELNLTRAAQRLYVSQPALTAYLNRLESDLGVKLFDRTKSPVKITPAGSYYIQKIKKLRMEEQTLRGDLQAIAAPAQVINLGIGQVRGFHWLPTLLSIFCARHPTVNINIMQTVETQTVDFLLNGQMDLGIGVLPPALNGLETVPLDTETWVLTAHRKFGLVPEEERETHRIEHPYRIDGRKLFGLPFIMPTISNGLYSASNYIVQNYNPRPPRIITTNNLSTGLYFATCGLGVELIYHSPWPQTGVSGLQDLDFFTVDKMPPDNRCIAAYHASNVKKDMLLEIINILQKDVIPYTDFEAK